MKENIKSQLSGLRAQINPHFLFNSLNTLSTLVHEDQRRADHFITKLSKVYRYMLSQDDTHLVLLRDELSYLDAYRHLLKERFGDDLIFEDHLDEKSLDKYIVPLSLQILFENCVKHNVATDEKRLEISMSTDSGLTSISITNNLQPLFSSTESNGVGLDNIMKRYACFTDQKVEVIQNADHFIVRLPLLSVNNLKIEE